MCDGRSRRFLPFPLLFGDVSGMNFGIGCLVLFFSPPLVFYHRLYTLLALLHITARWISSKFPTSSVIGRCIFISLYRCILYFCIVFPDTPPLFTPPRCLHSTSISAFTLPPHFTHRRLISHRRPQKSHDWEAARVYEIFITLFLLFFWHALYHHIA